MSQKHICDNCDFTCTTDENGIITAHDYASRPDVSYVGEEYGLHTIHHLAERLDPGSVVPSGECPDCGALAYLVKEKTV